MFDGEEQEEEELKREEEESKWYNNIFFLDVLIFVGWFLFLGIAGLVGYFCYPPVLAAFNTSEFRPSEEKDDDDGGGGGDGGGDDGGGA
jgi:hypothetical protein